MKTTPREKTPRRVSPFLAWGDFHARWRFARSTIPEEKWGTARSLIETSIGEIFHLLRNKCSESLRGWPNRNEMGHQQLDIFF